MNISTRMENNFFVMYLEGELDEATAAGARETMDELIMSANASEVVVDLGSLSFMDSTGVGVLIGRFKKLKGTHKRMYVRNPSRSVDKIFQMAGLYNILPLIRT